MTSHPIHEIAAAQTGTLIIIITTLVAVSCCVFLINKEKNGDANNEENR